MKKVPFVKYSLNGNSFVLLDETEGPILTESEKSEFSDTATNSYFGIGADNFIIVQRYSDENIQNISTYRNYWKNIPICGESDFIFRMFEPNGKEAFSCGNGLICIADYLFRKYNIQSCNILTEIPTLDPRTITIGLDSEKQMYWANIGIPKKIPPEIFNGNPRKFDNFIYNINNIRMPLKSNKSTVSIPENTLSINGYLIFIGEPHFVIFTHNGISSKDFTDIVFSDDDNGKDSFMVGNLRDDYSSWFVHYIGTYFNKTFKNMFPLGININFVHVMDKNGMIQYRCYERGINYETFSCGTGAVSVSAISKELGLCNGNEISVLPHRCRRYRPNAQYNIYNNGSHWYIYGNPEILYESEFFIDRELKKTYTKDLRLDKDI